MELDKAPRPNKFIIHFYLICWHIIKNDFWRMRSSTRRKLKMGGVTNSTFLALIPKDTNPIIFSLFWTNSLYNASYNIITKIIYLYLKPIMRRIISENQGGFIYGFQILGNALLGQEAIHNSRTRKEKGWPSKSTCPMHFLEFNIPSYSSRLRSLGSTNRS